MIQSLLDNKVALVLAALTALTALSLFLLSGCDLARHIQVNVPTGVQQRLALPPRIPLSESDDAFQQLILISRQDQAQFADSIQRGWDTFGLFSMAMNIGLSSAQASGLAVIPGGSLLLTLLAAASGLAINRPGTSGKIAKEKRDSYNAGIEVGRNGGPPSE